jgi:aspartyl-tRNA synthetase
MNKSTIIVKVQGNGSSAFKSGIERFQEDKRVKEVLKFLIRYLDLVITEWKNNLTLNNNLYIILGLKTLDNRIFNEGSTPSLNQKHKLEWFMMILKH